MVIDDKLKSLHAYFVRASSMHEIVMRMPDIVASANVDGTPEELRPALALVEAHNILAVFYALMFVVIEGVQDCAVSDPALDELFRSPHLDRFRRFRNAIFHFQPAFPFSDKQAEFMVEPDSEKWAKSVWRELNRWFGDTITRPSVAGLWGSP